MKKYFLILFTFLSILGYGQTGKLNSLQKILIGKWQDESSTFNLYANGNYVIIYNTGVDQKGKWSVKNNLITFKPTGSSASIQYEIIDYSSGDFGYFIINKRKRSAKSYHTIKINE